MRGIDDLLYDLSNKERNIEINRKERLETKAQRFATFGGIFISVISTYLLFISGNEIYNPLGPIVKCILLIAIVLFGSSTFLFFYSMKTRQNQTFKMESLIKKIQELELDFKSARKRVIGNINRLTIITRAVNNQKAKWLIWGIRLFFVSLIAMIVGLIISILIL